MDDETFVRAFGIGERYQSVGWRAVYRNRMGQILNSSKVVRQQKDAEMIVKQWTENYVCESFTYEVEQLFAIPCR